tara:strand:- start:67464 stop:67850 length:387 start_codon:yes stop_codon:yes gene_type:complete
MNNLKTAKKFTDWMNEGFCGKHVPGNELEGYQMTKQLMLSDGTTISIQAGRTHYCFPRTDAPELDYDFYSEFEIGFPSREIPEILKYAEDPECPTQTVYGWVPKEVIQDFINKAGGVKGRAEDFVYYG